MDDDCKASLAFWKAVICGFSQYQQVFCLRSLYKGANVVDRLGRNFPYYLISPKKEQSSATFLGFGASFIAFTSACLDVSSQNLFVVTLC